MRNPFILKNGLDQAREINSRDEIAFEEGIDMAEDVLERGPQEAKVRLNFFWFAIFILLIFISGRLYYLTVVQHEHFRQIAEGNRLRIEYLPAPRGAVYDRNGEAIASNKPSFELVASPLDLPRDEAEKERVINKVAEITGIAFQEIKPLLAQPGAQTFQSVLIKQNLEREQALVMHEQSQDLPGFRVVETPIRDYKDAEVFSHVLGFTGKINAEEYREKAKQGYLYNDTLGKSGLEQVYEKALRGEFGQRQVEVDARGVLKKLFGEKPAVPGSNLVLNIDAGLQKSLYDALARTGGGKKAAAIAQDPRSGRILALVSLPGFNNNLFAEGISAAEYGKLAADKNQPLFNRSIGGVYPPGSTVKPMVASAALQEGVVSEKTVIEDRGYIVIANIYGGPDYFFYGYNRQGLGSMNVRQAIALSSDIYFYTVGGGYEPAGISGLGISKLAKYYQMFKIDETLGIDLPGEKAGLVPTPEWKAKQFAGDPVNSQWFLGNTYHVSIGQGDLLSTPLHVLSWTSAIANGGKIWKPFVADRVESADGQVLERFEPKLLSELPIDKRNLEIVREGMRQTVTAGTAKSLNNIGVSVAGKTGTAQFDARNLSRTHAWFTAFAPFENPEIAIVVLVEDGGEGSSAAAPVARDVLDWWAKNRYKK